MGVVLPDHINVGERPVIPLAGGRVEMQTDTDIPRMDRPIGSFECLQTVRVSRQLYFRLFAEPWIYQRETLLPEIPIKAIVHLLDSSPQGFALGSRAVRRMLGSDHKLNRPRRAMRVEPLARFWIAIRTDLDVRATRLVVDEIPTLPSTLAAGRISGWPIFFLRNQIPLPGCFFLGQSLPRFVPQFMWSHVADGTTPCLAGQVRWVRGDYRDAPTAPRHRVSAVH